MSKWQFMCIKTKWKSTLMMTFSFIERFRLKGAACHWFYSLPRNSLRSFHDLTDAFYNQFASRRKFQRNNNHLLTVKMKLGKSLKNYVNYFQSQMSLIHNYNKDIVSIIFISGLQVIHTFYKHLVKNDVTKMKDNLVWAQNTSR